MLWKGFTAFYALLCNLHTFLVLGHYNISYQGHSFISKYPAFEVKGGIMWHFSGGSPQPYILILFPFLSLWLNFITIISNMKISNSCQSQKGGQFHLFNRRNSYGYNFTSFDMDFSIIVPQFYTLLMSKLFSSKFRWSSLRGGLFLQGSSYCSPFLYRIECPIKGLSRGFTILNVWFYIGSHV